MAKKDCICPCCEPEEEEALKYSIKELNQILADSIINVSWRYAVDGVPIHTDILGAISKIPIKYRTPLRILTFLNAQGRPEIWLYTGEDSSHFGDLTFWTKLYRPDISIHGGAADTNYLNF